MHGFGLYTDDVLSAVCITTEIPDSLNKEVRLEKLFVCEEERHYGVARKLLNHTLRTMRACGKDITYGKEYCRYQGRRNRS
mgnify:CR=1 FL=1